MALPILMPDQYARNLSPPQLSLDPLIGAIDDFRANRREQVQQNQFAESKQIERDKIQAQKDIAEGVQVGQTMRADDARNEARRIANTKFGEELVANAHSGNHAVFEAGLANARAQGWKVEQELASPDPAAVAQAPDREPPPAPPQIPGMPPLGAPPPKPPDAAPAVPTGGYRVTSPDGMSFSINPSTFEAMGKAQMEPRVQQTLDGAARLDKPALKQFAQGFMSDPMSFMGGPKAFNEGIEKQAIPLATQAHADERALMNAQAQAHKDQAGNPVSVLQLQRATIQQATDNVSKGYAIPEIRKAQQALSRVQSLVKSGGSLQQREAVLQELRAALGSARQSNQQLEHVMQSGGAWTQFETAANRWTGGGKLSPELVKELVGATQAVNATLASTLTDAGSEVYDGIMNDTTLMQSMDPKLQEQAARRARAQMVGETLGTPKDRPARIVGMGSSSVSDSSSRSAKGAAAQAWLEEP